MFIVKFNHKACKYSGISLINIDKNYLKLYIFMQAGFLFGIYTYFGYTDLTIDYLYDNCINTIFFNQIWFLEFILRSGFLFEILASFMIFARLLYYPILKLLHLWIIYLEYIYNNIRKFINKYKMRKNKAST